MARGEERRSITLRVNGRTVQETVEVRMTLADFLRDRLALPGTHLGCEQGVCGACDVLLDGQVVRSCLLLAVQAEGGEVTTVEGLRPPGGGLHPLQVALWEGHGLQCGFCTPGVLMAAQALLSEQPQPTEAEVRRALSGVLCRCTGYQDIVDSLLALVHRPPTPAAGGGGA